VAIRAITFDCAGTLVEVEYEPAQFAVRCLRQAGLTAAANAEELYRGLFRAGIGEFLEANRRNDARAANAFYLRLNQEWLCGMGMDPADAGRIQEAGEELAFGQEASFFVAYPEALDSLAELKAGGYRLGVVSNWDYTLPRVLEMLRISPFLEFALASLVEGVEKPDPRLFGIAAARFGLPASEILHVGDDEIDDRDGAIGAGMAWTLVDRTRCTELPSRIQTLRDLKEVLDWHC